MSTVKVVLLDIEGTVCPISFVKDVLFIAPVSIYIAVTGFSAGVARQQARAISHRIPIRHVCDAAFPYAANALSGTLAADWDDPAFARYRDAFPPEHRGTPAALEAHARDLMGRDVKAPYLKALQGYLWESGYASGRLTAPLFADVAPAITAWARDGNVIDAAKQAKGGVGRRVMIYSSGSVPAQKLLFRHTNGEPRDMTPLIADYFDTVNAGPKMEARSYGVIADRYAGEVERGEWLFLSDNVAEVKAAIEAGMQSCVVQRPGNADLPEGIEGTHRVIQSFDELDLQD